MEYTHSILITHRGNMNGERYLVNTNNREVHDLFNVKSNCSISTIMDKGVDQPIPSLVEAHREGYQDCIWCIGASRASQC